ncbi:MAG: hypothetical protein JO235_01545 [Chroococcidiopsidaceae cyanobacterium CP_BM_RX_35]|nr:hypothetical protein [Chroococcidiopsidaceae cyanobacterium CP_BM_RX_35]
MREGFRRQLPATGNPPNALLRLRLTALAPPQATALFRREALAERRRKPLALPKGYTAVVRDESWVGCIPRSS